MNGCSSFVFEQPAAQARQRRVDKSGGLDAIDDPADECALVNRERHEQVEKLRERFTGRIEGLIFVLP